MIARKLPKARGNPGPPRKAQGEILLLSRKLHPSLVVQCPACCWSDIVASTSSADRWVGDDVAPTSLDEGRGEVVPALMVVFHLGMKFPLVDGWAGGGGTSRRMSGQGSVPNAERWNVPFWDGARKRGFPWYSSPCRAEDKPCYRGKDGMCI